MRTKTDELLARAEAEHGRDPERAELIASARRFKASWFELGERLSEARRKEGYKKWGYASFADYCQRELHLRRDTAEKLTGSFNFLQSRVPEVLRRDGRDAPIPSYQAVDFWRRAEEAEAPAATLAELRHQVLDEGAELGKVTRLFGASIFPVDPAARTHEQIERLVGTIDRLVELLALARDKALVPKPLCAEVEEPLARLAGHLRRPAAKVTPLRRPPEE